MNLDLWKNRLIEQCPLLNEQVFLAVELASTEPNALTPPCAFIVPLSEKGANVSNANQKLTVQLAVVSVVQNVADYRGSEVVVELEAIRDQIKAALIGWQDAIGNSAVRFVGGDTNYFDDMILSWMDRFEYDHWFNKGR